MRHTITGDELEALDALKDWVRSWRELGGPIAADASGPLYRQMVEAGRTMLDIEERDEELRLAECRAEDGYERRAG